MADRSAVVIGAGISGVLVARELLLAGWRVTVLEAAHIGAGSSSRTAAGIRQQFSTPGTVHGMRYSVRFYRAFAQETEDHESPIVQNGYLFLHDDEARWAAAKTMVDMQRDAGLAEVDALDHAALLQRFPWLDPDAVIGGTHCPTDGFLLPHLVYNEGARRVRELGGTLLQHAPVTGVVDNGEGIGGVVTPKGTFEADLFLDCTNAWTRRLGRVLGADDLRVEPLKRYLWFLARGGPMTGDTLAAMPLVITPAGTYCRPENRDTLMMGRKHKARAEHAFDYEDQDVVEGAYSHTGGIDAVPFDLWAGVAEVIPDVGEFAGITATTSGYYAATPDHNPFLGFDPRRPNLIRLVGFSGHGAMLGPFTARVALALAEAGRDVDHVVLDDYAIPLDSFRIGRAFEHHEQMVI